tara:strand:+ start:1251 stop:2279 length:1029 start_codon:yes stop_codon:yes gene_type:complete
MAADYKQIYHLSNKLFTKLPAMLDHFGIEYIEYPNRYAFPCPVHRGDNPEGCTIFTDGRSSKGNWNCWTGDCHEEYKTSLYGFVRGVLSKQKNRKVSIEETTQFCLSFLGITSDSIEVPEVNEIDRDIRLLEIFSREPERQKIHTVTREEIRSRMEIPAKYYINRGFEAKTLDMFDVGLCSKKNQPMAGRVVVPIYDESYNYVGCIGRAVRANMTPKWMHSKGFKKSSYLYGLNIAKDFIKETNTVFLVEGQGDVWRMHEAGVKNTVGIFGSNLSEDQLILLEKSGALNVVILTDNDEAGSKAAKQIIKRGGRRFNYQRPQISEKDVGDMSVEQIKEEVLNI